MCRLQLADPAAFDYAPFWRGLLRECSSAARGLDDGLSEEGLQAASQMDEQPENLLVSCQCCHAACHWQRHLNTYAAP
jgi:hypothetical protein